MRKRPLTLIFCALIFLYFPVEFGWRYLQNEILFVGDFVFSIVLPFFLLVGLLRVNKIGWYTLIAFAALWGFKDLYELYVSEGQNVFLIFIHALIYGISLIYFINPRIRPLYFDPKMRWWRAKRRNETHTPIILKQDSQWFYPIIRNISEGGCFIETGDTFVVEDTLEVAIPLPVPLAVPVFKAKAEVRWVSPNPSRRGMGIQFQDMPPAHFKALKQFIRKQL